MQNAAIFFHDSVRDVTSPARTATVAIVRVLRIPGTLACPTFAR
jgi:hypothetical protein